MIFFFDNKFGRVFVPKFFHDKRAENFLLYVGDGPDNGRCEYREVGRKYYEYKKSTSGSSVKSVLATDLDWPFLKTYYKSIGSTVRGFAFSPPKLIWFTKKFHPTITNFNKNWIWNRRNNYNVPTQYSFYPGQQQIEENIKGYNNVPVKYFINESYFLYDKSDLIKNILLH